jgi:WbqC-like protein family
MKKIIAIHQPNYFPWLGYFYKIKTASAFVVLDNVDYQFGNANSITNRTKIKTANGELMLSLPVLKSSGSLISEMKFDSRSNPLSKHLKTIQMAYSKAAYFKTVFPMIENWLNTSTDSLSELNSTIIFGVCNYLQIETPIHIASQMQLIDEDKTGRLVEICKKLNGEIYLSGNGAKKYNDEELFNKNNIDLMYTGFKPMPYKQLHGEFISGLSIMDAMMNCSITEIESLLSGSNSA